jgi:ribosomal protein S18 acetylase RimI-like enzyme
MELNIRLYNESDFEPVTLLWRHSREISLPEFQREKGHPFDNDQWYFRNFILKQNKVWVAEGNGRPAGFLAMKDEFIDCLYVDPAHWQKGIGKALLDRARSISPGHVWLHTLQINFSARAFYQKNGFVARKFGLSPPPESEPDVEYHWFPKLDNH